eukprot:scaffold133259_cov22-Prasinocladus_malaysianus.AAC.1
MACALSGCLRDVVFHLLLVLECRTSTLEAASVIVIVLRGGVTECRFGWSRVTHLTHVIILAAIGES